MVVLDSPEVLNIGQFNDGATGFAKWYFGSTL